MDVDLMRRLESGGRRVIDGRGVHGWVAMMMVALGPSVGR